jgi:hypothetical protein
MFECKKNKRCMQTLKPYCHDNFNLATLENFIFFKRFLKKSMLTNWNFISKNN